MFTRRLFFFAALLLRAVPAAADVPQPNVRPPGIPANFRQLSPCIPGMGEHWAVPARKYNGSTIYGTYRGKPVFTELMLRREDFASGRSFDNVLRPLPGYRVDHVDIDFLPHGHPGMPFPHYDIHGYYVSHAVHQTFCTSR